MKIPLDIPPELSNPTDNQEKRLINRRQVWAANRFWMEMQNLKTRQYGNKRTHDWYALLLMMKTFKLFLRLTGMFARGKRNAENIVIREVPIYLPQLPPAFDGFTILHLSDLHLDGMEGLPRRIADLLAHVSVDLCVLTGDYRTALHGTFKHIINGLAEIIQAIESRHGFLGILGNHDGCHMVNPMEKIGIEMLVNSNRLIQKDGQRLMFIGIDDPHYYYTDQAVHALEYAEKEFAIALVHTPELYDIAAEMGVDLYLCGHTHAGQVCFPGGKAIITHLNRGEKFYRGLWNYQGMQGVTHAGVGTSGIPVRFNTQGEILIHKLIRRPGPSQEDLATTTAT